MGFPAARIGDMTIHGGSVVVGMPTVLIGGMPGARLGDMHVCPMVTPGTPPIPHVGGPILKGSAGVLVGGMPAARAMDQALCVGPPDMISLGCTTVLIGESSAGGGGGGGGGGGAGSGGGSAQRGSITSLQIAGESPSPATIEESSFSMSFTDGGKFPIGGVHYELEGPDGHVSKGILTGQLKRSYASQGNYTVRLKSIVNAQWSKATAKVGDPVDIIVDTIGVASGTPAQIRIFLRDMHYSDTLVAQLDASVSNDQIKVNWTLDSAGIIVTANTGLKRVKRYSRPFFYYLVIMDEMVEHSNFLTFTDEIEYTLKNHDGTPAKNEPYEIELADGRMLKGNLDGNGRVQVADVVPGPYRIFFPQCSEVVPQ